MCYPPGDLLTSDADSAGFSLEDPTGFRFLIRSRLFTDDEYDALGEQRPTVGVVGPG